MDYTNIIKDLIRLNNNQLENLLKITASRLGTTPEALKTAAESGQLDKIVGGNQASELQKVLSDPEAAKKLLSSPQAQKLLELFGKQ